MPEIFFRTPNVDLLYNFYFMHRVPISTPSGRKFRCKIFASFCKNDREGGVGGCIFPELGKVQGFTCQISGLQVNPSIQIFFAKMMGGGPIILLVDKAQIFYVRIHITNEKIFNVHLLSIIQGSYILYISEADLHTFTDILGKCL